ncbi:MAG: DUF177 domain-containing protein [Rhodospirillales bacterium]|nr:DUF177 domain-containing protein [Rhodospirillales bacterium]MCW8862918.1 DUF177 domain-containing protein [Rhodospirillales bacterium]MCW8951598.1 DUF177 domain-containing protein [Rhodospirillales bacterium]MCW8969677.1 DUF177 domain-containing protein [Rhodospirillales bacterium]MCW9003470.1 DUF177 domain-containing protein [Rhodospirillales bacterium]
MTEQPTNELSRLVSIPDIPPSGIRLTIEADETERCALAKRFDLVSIDSLSAEVEVNHGPVAKSIRLEGSLCANITERCVVTLQPLSKRIESAFVRVFTTQPETEESDEIEVWLDEDEPPEFIDAGDLDVGEVVSEQLGLDLDPFPRSEGAEFKGYNEVSSGDAPPEEKANPFAALQELRDKLKG